MLALALIFPLGMAALAAYDWRRTLVLVIMTALLQDPLRKVAVGQPVFLILSCGFVLLAGIVSASSKGVPLRMSAIVGWQRTLGPIYGAFLILCALQAINSLVRYGNPVIPVLGAISYLLAFPTLAFAYQTAVAGGAERVVATLQFYAIAVLIAVPSIYLQAMGVEAPILGEVGVGITITERDAVLQANSGIFRASEIAAWHVATVSSVVVMLLTYRRPTLARTLLALAMVAVLVGIGAATGRRKFLVQIVIFCIVYFTLAVLLLRGSMTALIGAASVGLLVIFRSDLVLSGQPESLAEQIEYDLYVRRLQNVMGDVPERFLELGLGSAYWALEHFGILGGGLGIATQGVQNLIADGAHLGAGEGGIGKIVLELGIPGLAILALLGVALAFHIWKVLRHSARHSPAITRIGCGLVGILAANAASFSVATQAFGDVFILIFLGTCIGFLLALPKLAT